MTILVWSAVGIALWHFTILIPDKFAGGIMGAFCAAWLGALGSGWMFEGLTVPNDNPPGMRHALYAMPGSLLALALSYAYGTRSGRHAATDSGEHAARTP
jgi:hypothetical protein